MTCPVVLLGVPALALLAAVTSVLAWVWAGAHESAEVAAARRWHRGDYSEGAK